jgi:hypothetical protein
MLLAGSTVTALVAICVARRAAKANGYDDD